MIPSKKIEKPKPCRKCGSKNLKIWNCGYNTFNPGGIRCIDCGHEVKVSDCDNWNPNPTLINAWNKNKKSTLEQLQDAKKEIKQLRKELAESKK